MSVTVGTRVELKRAEAYESFDKGIKGLAASLADALESHEAPGAPGVASSPPPVALEGSKGRGSPAAQGKRGGRGGEVMGGGEGETQLARGGGERRAGGAGVGSGVGVGVAHGAVGRNTLEDDAEDATDSAMHEAVATTLREEQRLARGADGPGSAGKGGSGGGRGGKKAGGRLLSMLPLRQGARAALEAATKVGWGKGGVLEALCGVRMLEECWKLYAGST